MKDNLNFKLELENMEYKSYTVMFLMNLPRLSMNFSYVTNSIPNANTIPRPVFYITHTDTAILYINT